MRKILTILFSVVFLHTGLTQTNPLIQDIINKVSIDSLTKFVNEISGQVPVIVNGQTVTITTRYYSTSTNDNAADYVKQKFESYGLQTYNQPFGSYGRNVYAVQTGITNPDQVCIICAHYDDMPSSGLAPGADDNASGSATVIEAARILKDYYFNYTIVYAVWDEEELGLIGSDYYAQNASYSGMDIIGVINMDMIAYDGNNDMQAEIHTRNIANSVALKDSMVMVNNNYSIGILASDINPGTTASDQASFWDYNYTAILLIENYYGGDFNPYYHTSNDMITHFNMPYYNKCAELSIGTLSLISGVEGETPVELTNFAGNWNGQNVNLFWATATETNNKGFEIERFSLRADQPSAENNWEKIGFVSGHGTTTEPQSYSFIDDKASAGSYLYRLKQIDHDGSFHYSQTVGVEANAIINFALEQNYPNPFNPTTQIQYSIEKDGYVNLTVYNSLGQKVASLVNRNIKAGNYHATFDASDLASGVYYYRLESGSNVMVKKMMILK
jgi:Peptidase family M28/Secretion system C-terminal sorting domain